MKNIIYQEVLKREEIFFPNGKSTQTCIQIVECEGGQLFVTYANPGGYVQRYPASSAEKAEKYFKEFVKAAKAEAEAV